MVNMRDRGTAARLSNSSVNNVEQESTHNLKSNVLAKVCLSSSPHKGFGWGTPGHWTGGPCRCAGWDRLA